MENLDGSRPGPPTPTLHWEVVEQPPRKPSRASRPSTPSDLPPPHRLSWEPSPSPPATTPTAHRVSRPRRMSRKSWEPPSPSTPPVNPLPDIRNEDDKPPLCLDSLRYTLPPPAKSERFRSLGFARWLASTHIVLSALSLKGAVSSVDLYRLGDAWFTWLLLLAGFLLTHARLNAPDPTVCVNPTHVCVNPTQACVNPTQVYVNPTQVYVNPTQACVNPTQVYVLTLPKVCVNPTQVCVNPTQVYVNPTQVYVNPTQACVNPTQVYVLTLPRCVLTLPRCV
jgi:hypothetical protein